MLASVFTRTHFFLVCTLFLATLPLFAQTTLNVGPSQPFTTIQSAINAANNGDTVLVAPGVYNEDIDFLGKAITVTSSGGSSTTIIDGGSKGSTPTVVFQNGEGNTSVLSNFTVRGGGESLFSNLSNGGIYITNASPVIQYNIISGNYCHNLDVEYGAPSIIGNEISNVLLDAQGLQGASYCFYRGGILINGGAGNNALGAVVTGNVIENNLLGQGVKLVSRNVLISNNIIRHNASIDPGSAVSSEGSGGTILFQNLIYGNVSNCGGALALYDYSYQTGVPSILVANNTIVDNVTQNLNTYTNCAFISQIYPSPPDYGVSDPSTVIVNNIISGSTSYPAVNCSWYHGPNESLQPTFQNNILYNADGPFFGSFCVNVSGEYSNVAADPQFVSPSTGDYHLKGSSPAIDSGQTSLLQTLMLLTGRQFTQDFDGNPRVQDATGHGCVIDIGAYEYPGNKSVCGTSETLQSSANPSTLGQTVTFTAQLASPNGVPRGSVQFSDGATVLATQALSTTGAATFSTGQLSVGSHNITAAYQPTGNFPATDASLTQIVNGYATTTALSSSQNPANVGQSVTFAAAVSSANGTPGGTVAFADGATNLATQPLISGTAAYTSSALAIGSHQITATYGPTGDFAASSSALTQIINGLLTTTSLTVTPNPGTAFGTLTLTATVTGAGSSSLTGSITFLANEVTLGSTTLNATAVASLSVAAPTPATYSITAIYSATPSMPQAPQPRSARSCFPRQPSPPSAPHPTQPNRPKPSPSPHRETAPPHNHPPAALPFTTAQQPSEPPQSPLPAPPLSPSVPSPPEHTP